MALMAVNGQAGEAYARREISREESLLEFESRRACAMAIADHLKLVELGDLVAPLSDLLADRFQPSVTSSGPAFGLILKRWVIRDDDLRLFDELNRAFLAAAGVGFFAQKATVSAIAGIATAMFTVLRNARRASARLSEDELVVLWAIRRAGGRSETELLQLDLFGQRTADLGEWNDERLRDVLRMLKDYPTISGIKHFVSLDGGGRWQMEGV